MNILQRINKVRSEVHGVQKDSKVSMGKSGSYQATSHDSVIKKLRASLVKHGIVFYVSGINYNSQTVEVTNDYGTKTKIVIDASVAVTYANEDDPQDKIETFAIGGGEDFGDKATGKALSYGVKYCHLKTFALVTGLNDEERIDYVEPPKPRDIKAEIEACKYVASLEQLWGTLSITEKRNHNENVSTQKAIILTT